MGDRYMQNKSILIVCLIVFLSINSFATTPTVCNIITPSNGSTTYNSRPFIIIQVGDPSYPINDICVRFFNNAACSYPSQVQQDWYAGETGTEGNAAAPSSFYQWQGAAGTTTMRFRPPATGYNVPAGTYWLVVYCMDSNPLPSRGWLASSVVQFTIASLPAWTGNTTVATGSPVMHQDFSDLRARIDTVRAFRGLAAYSSYHTGTPATGNSIYATDITDMQTALSQSYNAATGSNPTYTTSPGTGSNIKAADINDLRNCITTP